MRVRHLCLLAATLLVAVTGLAAQAKPDFSGVWTMVPDKSDFGPMQAQKPDSMTRTITHKDPSLKIVTVQNGPTGETTITTAFTTDGKPQANTVNGSPMTTTGKWDGTSISLHSTLSMQGTDVSLDDRYTLSDGGKTLTIVRKLATPDGDAGTATIVLTKK